MARESVLDEAKRVVNQRQMAYGSREDNFGRIAAMWSAILGVTVSPRQVALCMIAVKIARECWKPSRDNATDIAGYADCLSRLQEGEEDDGKRTADS